VPPGKAAKAEGKGAGRRGSGPVTVPYFGAITRQAMPVIIDAVGTVESEHSVAVRPQVSGVLQAVMFREGDECSRGRFVPYRRRPMQAAVEQVRAALPATGATGAGESAGNRLRRDGEEATSRRQEYDVRATQAKSLEATRTRTAPPSSRRSCIGLTRRSVRRFPAAPAV